MSSRQQSPTRTWWSLSSKSPNVASGKPYSTPKSGPSKSSGLNFNAIASAIGFRPKKHPSLTIQPPPVHIAIPASGTIKQVTRPPSRSVSSVWSAADSPQPQTPADGRRGTRQSLMTLSDVDPFAGNGVSARRATSNLPSLHSKTSIPEFGPKHTSPSTFNRISYASSSSHSNFYIGSELSPTSPQQSSPLTPDTPIQDFKPKGSLHGNRSIRSRDGSLVPPRDSLTQAHQPTISKSGSLSTITDKNRTSQPEPNSRQPPYPRPRGMTDNRASRSPNTHSAGPTYSRNLAVSNSVSTPISPRVIIRQASASRISSPPSAPPRHELPPPPLLSDETRDASTEAALASGGSGSSHSPSFASSASSNRDIFHNKSYSPRLKEKRSSGRSSPSSSKHEVDHSGHSLSKMTPPPLSAPRSLKKALSHQSLTKRGSSSSNPVLSPSTSSPERTIDKEPRKQRSFNQPKSSKFSVPSIRQASLTGSQRPMSPSDAAPPVERRRENTSASSTPSRKRLFSGSNLRRPSTAQRLASEDDALSVFSVRSEPEQASSFVTPVSPAASSSFWDEGTHDHTFESPGRPTHEYTPQHIMSPAEIAKVEASVEESSTSGRPRGLSVTSTPSVISDSDERVVTDSSSHSTRLTGTSNGLPLRINSLLVKGLSIPRRNTVRPSTSDAHPTASSTTTPLKFSVESPQAITSLPPPPRPRLRPSPVSQAGSPTDGYGAGPPSLPIRRILRAKSSVEKASYRRSIMKKPSFLEIDDDTDRETDGDSPEETMNSSFLDLARESFDTVWSVSD